MTIREQMEEREKEYLSPCATLSMASRGRKRNEPQCDIGFSEGQRSDPAQ